jgi:hypothetical protein
MYSTKAPTLPSLRTEANAKKLFTALIVTKVHHIRTLTNTNENEIRTTFDTDPECSI